MARIFAHELAIPLELQPVYDLGEVDAAVYADNPTRKVPVLERRGSRVIGTENICRVLAEEAAVEKHIVWPESLTDDRSRNAHELVWHAMNAQVQLVFGTRVCKLPADNLYFVKSRAGLEGALAHLDAHFDEVIAAFPVARDLSVFEVALFCLLEHLTFRQTVPLTPYRRLSTFGDSWGARASSMATAYEDELPPQV